MAKITLRITRLSNNLGRDDGLTDEPFWRPSFIFRFKELSANHLTSATICWMARMEVRITSLFISNKTSFNNVGAITSAYSK